MTSDTTWNQSIHYEMANLKFWKIMVHLGEAFGLLRA